MTDRSTPPEPSSTLLARARAGDQEAFGELFARVSARLDLFLRVRIGAALRRVEESADIRQEVFLATCRGIARFDPLSEDVDASLVRWLCQVAENCIRGRVDHHAAQKRRPPGDVERASQVLDAIAAGTLGPRTRAERAEARERLATALMELADEERDVMLMRHFEGLEIGAIADRLGTSPTSTRRLLGRAAVRLGAALRDEGDLLPGGRP